MNFNDVEIVFDEMLKQGEIEADFSNSKEEIINAVLCLYNELKEFNPREVYIRHWHVSGRDGGFKQKAFKCDTWTPRVFIILLTLANNDGMYLGRLYNKKERKFIKEFYTSPVTEFYYYGEIDF